MTSIADQKRDQLADTVRRQLAAHSHRIDAPECSRCKVALAYILDAAEAYATARASGMVYAMSADQLRGAARLAEATAEADGSSA